VGGGIDNSASGRDATIGGGNGNTASGGWYATVGGGFENTAANDRSTVGGGYQNKATDAGATIAGGQMNMADGYNSTIGGGFKNHVTGDYSAILGGYADTIETFVGYSYLFGIRSRLTRDSTFMVDMPHIRFGDETDGYEFPTTDGSSGQVMTTDGTGQLSWADPSGSGGNWSVTDSVLYTNSHWGIARGGVGNILYGDDAYTMVNLGVACTTGTSGEDYLYSTVSGGFRNAASGNRSTVGGGIDNSASGRDAIIGGGNGNTASGQAAFVGGGEENAASGYWSTIGGGEENSAVNYYATVAGGDSNTASGYWSTIGGGEKNGAVNFHATVAGGGSNTASGSYSTVGGGDGNTAGYYHATVAGGKSNTASGRYSVVPGGDSNTAGGSYSFAAGRRAKANHDGAFVWADETNADFASTESDQFLIRASGGVGIGTNSPQGALDVSSTTGAFIVPRMTTTQRNALAAVNGMIIYNTTTNQFNFYENGAWVTKS
jgi:hypothetical protein